MKPHPPHPHPLDERLDNAIAGVRSDEGAYNHGLNALTILRDRVREHEAEAVHFDARLAEIEKSMPKRGMWINERTWCCACAIHDPDSCVRKADRAASQVCGALRPAPPAIRDDGEVPSVADAHELDALITTMRAAAERANGDDYAASDANIDHRTASCPSNVLAMLDAYESLNAKVATQDMEARLCAEAAHGLVADRVAAVRECDETRARFEEWKRSDITNRDRKVEELEARIATTRDDRDAWQRTAERVQSALDIASDLNVARAIELSGLRQELAMAKRAFADAVMDLAKRAGLQ